MGIGYSSLWNAFKRMLVGASDTEKTAIFSRTAARVYRIDLTDCAITGMDSWVRKRPSPVAPPGQSAEPLPVAALDQAGGAATGTLLDSVERTRQKRLFIVKRIAAGVPHARAFVLRDSATVCSLSRTVKLRPGLAQAPGFSPIDLRQWSC